MKLPTCGHYSDCGRADGGCCDHPTLKARKPSYGTCNLCGFNPIAGKMEIVTVTVGATIDAAANAARLALLRNLWHEIHTAALSPAGLTDAMLDGIRSRLPCGPCRAHFDALRESEPLPGDVSEHFALSAGWHNAINAELGKPVMTVGEATALGSRPLTP